MLDFVKDKTDKLDPLEYLEKNVIVVRSFSNFYGYENLEISYVMASEEISKILRESNIVVNQIDSFHEQLAIECLKDTENNKKLLNDIEKEKERVYTILKKNNIDFYKSDTNYLLINPQRNKEDIIKDLEKNKIILNNDDLNYNDFWSIPLSTPDILRA